MFSCEFCEISKNTFLYRTPLVAASGFIDKYLIEIFKVRISNVCHLRKAVAQKDILDVTCARQLRIAIGMRWKTEKICLKDSNISGKYGCRWEC